MDNAILRFKRAWEHAQRAIILVSVPAGQDTQTPLPALSDEEIPEFPTVALPAAMVLGLVFFMQKGKKN
ncbi:MAG: hypothetical protein SVY15_02010 [Halobacteriota archaeon]|nr:hypothetical protein [Halobacteriota archaeon]